MRIKNILTNVLLYSLAGAYVLFLAGMSSEIVRYKIWKARYEDQEVLIDAIRIANNCDVNRIELDRIKKECL